MIRQYSCILIIVLLNSLHLSPVEAKVFSYQAQQRHFTNKCERLVYLRRCCASAILTRSFAITVSYPSTFSIMQNTRVSGGDASALSLSESKVNTINSAPSIALALWGTLGVVMLLLNAIKRLLPVALQPFAQNDFEPIHIASYVLWTLYMSYVEGYQAFHLKFSPLVVRRALTIYDDPTIIKCILAGPYSMGLFGATKKRMVVSWLMMVGVFLLVKIVKLLPYPWRSIVDSGVVAGLSIGTVSIGWHFMRAMFGRVPNVDPCLPRPDEKLY
jgi:hypothetical protein